MYAWASMIGLTLTCTGVLMGFYLPTVAGRFGGPETAKQEYWLRLRFVVGVGLVVAGTLLQIYAAIPR
jgi:hypothetical protein